MTFSPADIPNAQLWLDADTLTTADGATVTGTWVDGSGAANDATANGGLTMRTSGIGGHQAVEFNGSSGYFQIADNIDLRFTTRIYIAAVIHVQAHTQALLSKGDNAGDPDYLFFLSLSADGALNFYDGGSFRSSATGAISTGTDVLVEMVMDGANHTFSVNGVTVSETSAAAIQQSSEPLRIGRQGSGAANPFSGRLAELILVGNGTADASGETSFRWQAETRAYLLAKYGLGTPVPVDYIVAYNGGSNGTDYRVGGAIGDGTSWVRANGYGTVLSGSGWESSYVKDPCLVFVDPDWYLYYCGYDGTYFQVGRATGVDGFSWTKDAGNPVLPRGGSGTWDERHVNFPFVIYDAADSDPSKRWKMWFSGSSVADPGTFKLGYAYSSDGIAWTKHASNPILTPGGTYDLHGLIPPCVSKSGPTWHLFYGGVASTGDPGGFSLCHATASNAEGPWTKDAGNPLLSPSTALQTLTSGTSSGSAVYHVADTSDFNVGEPVFVKEGSSIQLTKVSSIDSSTQLTTTTNATTTWTTAATIRSAYWGSIVPRSIEDTGAGWRIFGTAFQQFSNSPFYERSVVFEAPALGGTWTFDYPSGVILPLGTWDSSSAENPSVVLVATTPTTPPEVGNEQLVLHAGSGTPAPHIGAGPGDVWVCEHDHAAVAGARLVLGRDATANGDIDVRVLRRPAGTGTWAQAVADDEAPSIPPDASWGPLASLASPLLLDRGDELTFETTAETRANIPAGSSLRLIALVAVDGFDDSDRTTTHEWSP